MKLSLSFAIILAAIAWIVLFVILSVPLWISLLVAAVIIVAGLAEGGHREAAS
jgi:hypothetical protein